MRERAGVSMQAAAEAARAWKEAQRQADAREREELEETVSAVEAELEEASKATARSEGRAQQAEKAQERAEAAARTARDELAEAHLKITQLMRQVENETGKKS